MAQGEKHWPLSGWQDMLFGLSDHRALFVHLTGGTLQAELKIPASVPPADCFISSGVSCALLLMLAAVSRLLWSCESKICKYLCSVMYNLYTKLEVLVLNAYLQLGPASPSGRMLSLSAEVVWRWTDFPPPASLLEFLSTRDRTTFGSRSRWENRLMRQKGVLELIWCFLQPMRVYSEIGSLVI